MNVMRQDGYRLRDIEIDPAKLTIAGPGGVTTVRASSMEVLCRLAERPGAFFDARRLARTVFPNADNAREELDSSIGELRKALGDRELLDHDQDLGFRLLATPEIEAVADNRPAGGDWFDELKRRRVFRAVAAYAVAAWLILQIVDVLAGALPVPNWTLTATTVALAIGFPVSAFLAWIFQITPAGVVVEDGVDGRKLDRTRLIHYFDLVIIGILIIIVAFLSYGHVFPSLQRGEEVRVAVLPFDNLSAESADAYLSEGIADDIRSRLYELPQVLVAARSSSRSLAGLGLDISSLGARLGVNHILEGTFRRVDDRIRLSVQLVDVDTGFSSWEETYDARIEDVLALQDRISLIVASELKVVLTSDVRQILAENVTDDPVAFDLYLQARSYLDRPRTVDVLAQATTLFEQAIAQDSEFALAYAGLCAAQVSHYRETGDTAFVQPAERNCNKALSLDARLPDVHVALGDLYTISGDYNAAEAAFNRAIEFDPRSVEARTGLGRVFLRQDRFDDAEAQYILATELRPADWRGYDRFGRFLIAAQRYPEAIDKYERAIELAPNNPNGFNNLGVVYYFLGDYARAAEYYRRSIELEPDGAPYSNSGTMEYFLGNYSVAADMFGRALETTPTDYRIWGNLADALRFTGATKERVDETYGKAVELADLRLNVNPQDRETLVNLSWYYANLDRPDAARDSLDAANPQAISDEGQLYTVALVLMQLGDAASARQYLDKAAALGFPQAMIDATPELAGDITIRE